MVVSAAIGVFAVIFLSHQLWGVLAAIGLAFSSVGFLAGLLMVQRKSWADKTWPPGGRTRTWSDRRARRMMLFYGGFILLVSVAGSVSLFWADPEEAGETTRTWVLLGTFGVLGIVFMVLGARPVRASVVSETRPDDAPSVDEDGWVRLGPDGSAAGAGWGSFSYFPLFQVPMLLFVLLPTLTRLPVWAAPAAVGILIAVIVVVVVVLRRRARSPWVSTDGTTIRHGTKEVPASQITAAHLFWAPWTPDASERSLTITFTGPNGFRSTVGLRKRGHLVLNHTETAHLLDLVRQSVIELPRDGNDPTGRFSKALYPTHLTKPEALAVIEDPPGDGEKLPVAAPPAT
ncbi:hypothetical protein [Microbacterium sp. P02]|uniref:hypothetical protein n=1 Tax=Microbacterium sp. P02 TaxID=3366260 RepID=UPI00366D8124